MKSKSKALERPQSSTAKRFYLLYSNPRQKARKTKKLRQQQMVNKQPKPVILQQNNATTTINNLVNS
ncbi:hypothetical protein B5D77_07595 [Microcystis sp. MC19]|uniref:hypothetical protein n=1 Tax=Microcystis sp. MC19 TaxID=1967666 RepID=UPI000D13CEEE|nr:hypothetical protein [Microcystis sp. MC19]AVQ71194.1 hypothetical protein B5D77_07595 [Microcystis sp. MC19]